MKPFMDENFLLQTETAQKLYHEHAAKMPIIDYHCHLIPQMVADNKRFESIAQIWLMGDHYKWRAMRSNGVNERFCTGKDTTDWEKFEKWAETVPYTFRNPLYHWTHLELKTAFGITETLNPTNARAIYDKCNEMIANDPKFCPRGMMEHYNVKVVCTTDDPADTLEWHKIVKDDPTAKTKILPTWRPDAGMNIEAATWKAYIEKLSAVAGVEIKNFATLNEALQKRHDFFNEMGCRLSDHGIEEFYDEPYTTAEIDAIMDKALCGQMPTVEEQRKYKHAYMHEQGIMDYNAGWTQQYHMNSLRNNNTPIFEKYGADVGFDSVSDEPCAKKLNLLMNEQEKAGKLPRTILYTLNPGANYVLGTTCGNFQTEAGIPGKIQFGSGWWFCDQKNGMEKQMNALSLLGLLSRFVGMLTDSRSFLSYPRHEYFRRTLCNLLGNDVENGEIPYEEIERVEQMVEDISYNNAKNFFKF